MEGTIFDIQRFSIHDGPGIRTTVFFKGCNLRCFWCHNPESWDYVPEIQVFPEKCICCGKCLKVCPNNAHHLVDGQKTFLRELCKYCGKCADQCYADSLVLIGTNMSVQEVMAQVELDRVFYANSGGGVTFSGGEPLLQKDFLKALLMESQQRGFHTAVDTSGNVPWETFEHVMPYTDLFLFDLKVITEELHKQVTGAGNQKILANLIKLSQRESRIVIRVPVVPGVNNTPEEMEHFTRFISTLPHVEYTELVNYHRLGEGKYESLGRMYEATGLKPNTQEEMQQFGDIFKNSGLRVKIS